jgi:hypothetical protein
VGCFLIFPVRATVKPWSIIPGCIVFPGSILQFLWSLNKPYFKLASTYLLPISTILFQDPWQKWWIKVSLYSVQLFKTFASFQPMLRSNLYAWSANSDFSSKAWVKLFMSNMRKEERSRRVRRSYKLNPTELTENARKQPTWSWQIIWSVSSAWTSLLFGLLSR